MLVVMADQLALSVGNLFMGALIPGVILGGLYIAYIIIYGIVRPQNAPLPSDQPPLIRNLPDYPAAADAGGCQSQPGDQLPGGGGQSGNGLVYRAGGGDAANFFSDIAGAAFDFFPAGGGTARHQTAGYLQRGRAVHCSPADRSGDGDDLAAAGYLAADCCIPIASESGSIRYSSRTIHRRGARKPTK